MRRLPDNLTTTETAMRTCLYSMPSTEPSPKALAWMAALCAAAGHGFDAEQWLVELIGAVVFTSPNTVRVTGTAPQDIANMS